MDARITPSQRRSVVEGSYSRKVQGVRHRETTIGTRNVVSQEGCHLLLRKWSYLEILDLKATSEANKLNSFGSYPKARILAPVYGAKGSEAVSRLRMWMLSVR